MSNTYRLTNTGESSRKFGKCQCCGEHVSEVFLLAVYKVYKRPTDANGNPLPPKYRPKNHGNPPEYGQYNTKTLFGHQKCLVLLAI